MDMAKKLSPSAEQQLHSRYSIVKRIVNLALAIIISLLFINVWLLGNEQVENWHHKQANQLGNSLSLLASKVLVTPLIQKDPIRITNILQQWMADPNVLSIAVHDQNGQLLQQQGDNITLLSRYHNQQKLPLVFLEDIHNEQQIYGYVRLMLSAEKVMAYHNDFQRQLRQQLEMFILLAACGALILTRAFYKVRYRNYAKTVKNIP
ncbi:MAG: membrane protein [Paraglaciecola sp.]|jgi:membrane protein